MSSGFPLMGVGSVLHTDGASKGATNSAGCGGAVRDAAGRWLTGFSKQIGTATAFEAELWGVWEGLQLARSLGFAQVELRLDSETVLQSIKGGKLGSVRGLQLVRRIRSLMEDDWQVRVIHVYREANKVADCLAGSGCSQDAGLVVYTHPPSSLVQLLHDDVMGVSTPKLVPM